MIRGVCSLMMRHRTACRFHDALLRGFALYRDIALFWTAPLSRRSPSKAERALRTHVIRNAVAEGR